MTTIDKKLPQALFPVNTSSKLVQVNKKSYADTMTLRTLCQLPIYVKVGMYKLIVTCTERTTQGAQEQHLHQHMVFHSLFTYVHHANATI